MAGDPYKIKKNKVPVKDTNTYRILALDAATNITGYAIYDNKTLVSFGTFKTNSSHEATERINQFKGWLRAALNAWQPDFVGVENIRL
jgi:Holliday junction resolvasome RuvABC endonuclease subunit